MARSVAGSPVDGMVSPAFFEVARVFRQVLGSRPGGGAVCVYHRGACVVDLWGGVRDRAGSAWRRDTLAPSFSTTKGVAATLLHMAADRGLVDYDERVAAYWPAFGKEGKDGITVRHVLAHQSGLYHIRQMIDRADRMLDWEHMVDAIERTPPCHPPGERTGYHGLTFGFLVGEILRRVTGRSFSDLVRRELAEPLELGGLYVGAPDDALDRAAQLISGGANPSPWTRRQWTHWGLRRLRAGVIAAAELARPLTRAARLELDLAGMLDALAPRGIGHFDFGSPETLRAAIPSANGLFDARSLARMYAALSRGGELDGVRLLSSRTLARASRPQSPAPGRAVIPFDMRWRLGYHGVFTSRGAPRHAFGHFGYGGSGAWADPSRQLAVAFVTNSGMTSPFGDLRILRLGGAALACADRRAGRHHTPLRSLRTLVTRP